MRTHLCKDINHSSIGSKVVLSGWVHNRRDLGGLIFLKIRDSTGFVQAVIDPSASAFGQAEQVRQEYVVCISGESRLRPKDAMQDNPDANNIEIIVENIEILNSSIPLPFLPDDLQKVSEEVRLKYRYIDLRRPQMLQRLQLRAKITSLLRNFLNNQSFLDIETPILTKATPEGARDYLVPSRVHKGSFFALPQSPQIFKQLLMISGVDKYYQIVRCFRDEDLRADRQPEFTQLDIEMSFVNEQNIMELMESMLVHLFAEALQVELPTPFMRMSYATAMEQFGTDRPDLRNPLRLVEVADLLKNVDFKVFQEPANSPDGRVAAIKVPQGAKKLTRKMIDNYAEFVKKYGAKGLAYIKVNSIAQGRSGLQSPILKFLSDDALNQILSRLQAQTGDIIFFAADSAKIVSESLAALRDKVGVDLDLLQGAWKILWIVDFPMFEWDSQSQRYVAVHHPFTSPQVANADEFLAQDPAKCLSKAYDLVLNGSELGGGSIRIHDLKMQQAIFTALGMSDAEVHDKFSFLLDALQSGCPPHGGIAFGLDRLVMLMSGAFSIRDVIAFPKTLTASCPLTCAPTAVCGKQLSELGIKLESE